MMPKIAGLESVGFNCSKRSKSVRPRGSGDRGFAAKTGFPREPVIGPAKGRTRWRERTGMLPREAVTLREVSLRLDGGGLDHLRPLYDLSRDEFFQLFRRAGEPRNRQR